MKKHAHDYVWHFDFESLLLSRSRGFRMERASDITKTGTIRFSLCVLFFQGGSSICRSRAIPTSGKMMVISYVSSIYPVISASHRSDYDSYVSYQELRSQWPNKWSVSSLNFAKISHISSLYTLISSIGWLSGWKQDWAVVGMVRLHLVSFPKLLRGGQEQDIWIP